MKQPVFLYGAGGHAKVILELLEEEGRTIGGLIDDDPVMSKFLDYSVRRWNGYKQSSSDYIISIGNNEVRKKIALKVGGPFTRAFHKNSYMSPRASWGEGTVLMSGVSVNSGSQIGSHCVVNTHASVDHDCRVADFAHIAPHAVLCGDVIVGEGTLIGAGAVVVPGVTIGRWALIGAGAVVRQDIPDGATVVGNPGRIFLIRKDLPDGDIS